MARRAQQLELSIRSWGGRREGAGRKPSSGRRSVPHRARPVHAVHCPVHVTLRAAGLPSLRGARTFGVVRTALAAASNGVFRIVQWSVQVNHLHLIVEADEPAALAKGVQGLAVRIARAVNRVSGRRGAMWEGRYHAHALRTPLEVRRGLLYVLQNWQKHVPGAHGVDPRSSAAWFTGWRERVEIGAGPAPVAAARTWLARMGWRRHGSIGVEEAPRRRDRKGRASRWP